MTQKDSSSLVEKHNRFFIQGEGNIKYTFNNGVMAKEPETASLNFLRALEKLPTYIKKEQENMSEFQKDIPILQEVVNGTWAKEKRLSELKTELAGIDRKIQLSIKPETQEVPEKAELEKQKATPQVSESTVLTKGIHLPRGVL